MWCHDIDDAVERKHATQFQAFDHLDRDQNTSIVLSNSNLPENIFPAESWQALIPDRGKQLLDAGVKKIYKSLATKTKGGTINSGLLLLLS